MNAEKSAHLWVGGDLLRLPTTQAWIYYDFCVYLACTACPGSTIYDIKHPVKLTSQEYENDLSWDWYIHIYTYLTKHLIYFWIHTNFQYPPHTLSRKSTIQLYRLIQMINVSCWLNVKIIAFVLKKGSTEKGKIQKV